MLLVLLARVPGEISLDRLIRRRFLEEGPSAKSVGEI